MASVLQTLLPGPAAGPSAPAASAPKKDVRQGPPGRPQGRFGAALRAGAWPTGLPAADTSLEAVCTAAGALMTHWSVLPDGALPVRRLQRPPASSTPYDSRAATCACAPQDVSGGHTASAAASACS